MAKRGQPRKITGHIARKMELLYAYGLTDVQIADVFGIAVATISNYKNSDDYLETITQAKTNADLKVVNALFLRAIGQYEEEKVFCSEGSLVRTTVTKHAPDTKACELWLTNRQRQDWRKEAKVEENLLKPPMIRIFEKMATEESALITRGDNQIDILFGKDFVDEVKAKKNGTDTNGTHSS